MKDGGRGVMEEGVDLEVRYYYIIIYFLGIYLAIVLSSSSPGSISAGLQRQSPDPSYTEIGTKLVPYFY